MENLLSIKEVEIPVVFHNYKLLKDKSFVLKGSHIYFVQGCNEIGKSSFLKALTGVQIAKDDTPEKVTRGEEEGYYEFTIPSATGEEVTIRHEFTNDKSKFIAIDSHGTKISSVTDIRNLFNYTPINVSEFFAMSNSVEGRRKQRDIILKLLPETERKAFNELDLQEQHYYTQRTETNRLIDLAKNKLIVIPQEHLDLIPKEEEAKKLIQHYTDVIDLRERLPILERDLKELNDDKIRLEEDFKKLLLKIESSENIIKKTKETLLKYEKVTDEEFQTKLERGNNVVNIISSTKTKQELNTEAEKSLKTNTKESNDMTVMITECRDKKAKIITDSELPVENISFEDGYLTIDGFVFTENQVCESDAILILANILAKINPGPIQIIGNASLLDNDKLDRLNKIAEDNNKIMFVDEIVRSADNMVIVGYEELNTAALRDGLKIVEKTGKAKVKTKKPIESVKENSSVQPEVKDSTESQQSDEDKPLF